MKDSIVQGLMAAVAGMMFCIAVTLLLFEVKAISDMERNADANYGVVWEKGADDYGVD